MGKNRKINKKNRAKHTPPSYPQGSVPFFDYSKSQNPTVHIASCASYIQSHFQPLPFGVSLSLFVSLCILSSLFAFHHQPLAISLPQGPFPCSSICYGFVWICLFSFPFEFSALNFFVFLNFYGTFVLGIFGCLVVGFEMGRCCILIYSTVCVKFFIFLDFP